MGHNPQQTPKLPEVFLPNARMVKTNNTLDSTQHGSTLAEFSTKNADNSERHT
jgi:hypothetical protein